MKMLLNQLFEFTLDHSVEERERILMARIGHNEPIIVDALPLLNDILNIKLPLKPAHLELDEMERHRVILETLEVGRLRALVYSICLVPALSVTCIVHLDLLTARILIAIKC